MLDNFSIIVFNIFNETHMAIGCIAIAAINLYLSRILPVKKWPRRVKAFNWLLLAVSFLLVFFAPESSEVERSWLRFTFGLLVIGELAYYGDIIIGVLEQLASKIK